jgi:hypothetical protein
VTIRKTAALIFNPGLSILQRDVFTCESVFMHSTSFFWYYYKIPLFDCTAYRTGVEKKGKEGVDSHNP